MGNVMCRVGFGLQLDRALLERQMGLGPRDAWSRVGDICADVPHRFEGYLARDCAFAQRAVPVSIILAQDLIVWLTAAYSNDFGWNLDNDELRIWEGLVGVGIEKARDDGITDSDALSKIAEHISQPTSSSCARAAEILLRKCRLSEDEELPFHLIELIATTLRSSYPPAPAEITSSLWMIRALGELIDGCPPTLLYQLLENLVDGISVWVADETEIMSPVEGYGDVSFLRWRYEVTSNCIYRSSTCTKLS